MFMFRDVYRIWINVLTTFIMYLITYGIVVYNYGSHNLESINVPVDENIQYMKCYLRMRISRKEIAMYGCQNSILNQVHADRNIWNSWRCLQMSVTRSHDSAYGWPYPKLMKVSTDDHIRKSWRCLPMAISGSVLPKPIKCLAEANY